MGEKGKLIAILYGSGQGRREGEVQGGSDKLNAILQGRREVRGQAEEGGGRVYEARYTSRTVSYKK